MYSVYADKILIHQQDSPDRRIHLLSPNLKMADNAAGSLDFIMAPDHMSYNDIEEMRTTIYVRRDGHTIWSGRAISSSIDFQNRKSFTCEGALAFLNDSLQPNKSYKNVNNKIFFEALLNQHNAKVGKNREIMEGLILPGADDRPEVTSTFDYETCYEKTWSVIQSKFLDRIGGHIRIRYGEDNKTPILDYFDENYQNWNTPNQTINFGMNLLDYSSNVDLSNLVTVIYPRGKEITD